MAKAVKYVDRLLKKEHLILPVSKKLYQDKFALTQLE